MNFEDVTYKEKSPYKLVLVKAKIDIVQAKDSISKKLEKKYV